MIAQCKRNCNAFGSWYYGTEEYALAVPDYWTKSKRAVEVGDGVGSGA